MTRPFNWAAHPSVIAFAEIEAQRRMGYGVAEPRQHLPVIREDIAVVERHHPRLLARQHIAETIQTFRPLPLGPGLSS